MTAIPRDGFRIVADWEPFARARHVQLSYRDRSQFVVEFRGTQPLARAELERLRRWINACRGRPFCSAEEAQQLLTTLLNSTHSTV